HAHAGGNPPDREREARRAGARQGVDFVHHRAPRAPKGGGGLRRAAGGDRPARGEPAPLTEESYFFCQDARRKRLRRDVMLLRVPAYSCTFWRISCRMSSGSAAAASSKREITSSPCGPSWKNPRALSHTSARSTASAP